MCIHTLLLNTNPYLNHAPQGHIYAQGKHLSCSQVYSPGEWGSLFPPPPLCSFNPLFSILHPHSSPLPLTPHPFPLNPLQAKIKRLARVCSTQETLNTAASLAGVEDSVGVLRMVCVGVGEGAGAGVGVGRDVSVGVGGGAGGGLVVGVGRGVREDVGEARVMLDISHVLIESGHLV